MAFWLGMRGRQAGVTQLRLFRIWLGRLREEIDGVRRVFRGHVAL